MSQIIEIIVSPNGETKVETKGFIGAECREASKFIEEALGRKPADETTAEFHQVRATQQSRQQA